MKFILEIVITGQVFRHTVILMFAGISTIMNRSDDPVGQVAGELHDIYFTAGRPTDRINISAQHPQGRPKSLSFGQGGPTVYSSEFKEFFALCHQAGGSVFATTEVLFFGGNN